jgi:hypothetical protein
MVKAALIEILKQQRQQREIPDGAPVPASEMLKVYSPVYKPSHPNLFRNAKGKQIWVMDIAVKATKRQPGWTFVRRAGSKPIQQTSAPSLSVTRLRPSTTGIPMQYVALGVVGIAGAAAYFFLNR